MYPIKDQELDTFYLLDHLDLIAQNHLISILLYPSFVTFQSLNQLSYWYSGIFHYLFSIVRYFKKRWHIIATSDKVIYIKAAIKYLPETGKIFQYFSIYFFIVAANNKGLMLTPKFILLNLNACMFPLTVNKKKSGNMSFSFTKINLWKFSFSMSAKKVIT